MGACSSCLGGDRDRDLSDEDESTRLLFDDPNGNNYGSLGDHNIGVVQADPLEVQRENEALQKVVTQTSSHLVDIFAMVSQNPPNAVQVVANHDARFLRYQDVLAKISMHDQLGRSKQQLNGQIPSASDGWLSEDDEVEGMKERKPVKSDGIGPILGGFADADSAME